MKPRSDAPDEQPTPPWLADALDEARAPEPRAEFREALRARLVGEASTQRTPRTTATRSGADPEAPSSSGRTPRSRRDTSSPAPRWGRRLWLVAALAAASIAVWWLRPLSAPRVELVESALAGLTLDGEAIDEREFESKLFGGSRLRASNAPVRLRIDGVALIELAAGAEAVVRPWNADGAGEARIELARGGIRVVTAPDFAPRKLTVLAPDAQVTIVGTEFGVDVVEGLGTCVCCTHGAIEVRPRGRERADRVLAGGMSFCFASGEAPMLGEVKEDHAAEVTALRRFGWPTEKR